MDRRPSGSAGGEVGSLEQRRQRPGEALALGRRSSVSVNCSRPVRRAALSLRMTARPASVRLHALHPPVLGVLVARDEAAAHEVVDRPAGGRQRDVHALGRLLQRSARVGVLEVVQQLDLASASVRARRRPRTGRRCSSCAGRRRARRGRRRGRPAMSVVLAQQLLARMQVLHAFGKNCAGRVLSRGQDPTRAGGATGCSRSLLALGAGGRCEASRPWIGLAAARARRSRRSWRWRPCSSPRPEVDRHLCGALGLIGPVFASDAGIAGLRWIASVSARAGLVGDDEDDRAGADARWGRPTRGRR